MKIFLKIFYVYLFLWQGTNTFAATENVSSGWRLGLGIAGEYAKIEADLKVRPGRGLSYIESSEQQSCKKLQVSPGFELGKLFANNFYLGFVTSWHYSNAKTMSRTPIKGAYYFLHQFKLNSYLNAFIKPGYRLSPTTMVYGLVGPSIANWSHTTQEVSYNGNTQISTPIDTFKMQGKTVGLGIGCGFEYLIQNKYALSMEYTTNFHRAKSANKVMSYKDSSFDGLGNPILIIRTDNLTKIVQPSYSTFAVRLTYFFSLF